MHPSELTPPQSAADSPWVIQKFGGTSVGKFATNIVDHIVMYVWPQRSDGTIPLTRSTDPVSQSNE